MVNKTRRFLSLLCRGSPERIWDHGFSEFFTVEEEIVSIFHSLHNNDKNLRFQVGIVEDLKADFHEANFGANSQSRGNQKTISKRIRSEFDAKFASWKSAFRG